MRVGVAREGDPGHWDTNILFLCYPLTEHVHNYPSAQKWGGGCRLEG